MSNIASQSMAPLSGDFNSLPPTTATATSGGKTNVVMFDTTKNPVYKVFVDG